MVDTKGEVGCWHACNRFGDVAVVEATLLFRRSGGPVRLLFCGGSFVQPWQGRREALCLGGTGRRGFFAGSTGVQTAAVAARTSVCFDISSQ